MLNQLAVKLAAQGLDVSTLRTLEDVVTDNNREIRHNLTDSQLRNPVYTLAVNLDDTVALYQELESLTSDLGYSAVILGDKDSLMRHCDIRRSFDWSPISYLKAAETCTAEAWFQEHWEDLYAFDEEFSEADIRSNSYVQPHPYTTLDLARLYLNPAPLQYIGLLPTTINSDLPAFLPFGSWNTCPSPDEHTCVHRYWHQTYQSHIVAMLYDKIICRVEAPVKDPKSALDLARQYMVYCEDSVFQGTGSLDSLAANLVNSTYWSFWWD